MDDPIPVMVGDWNCGDDGIWKFVLTKGTMARCVSLSNGICYKELCAQIRRKFDVDCSGKSFQLSFWFAKNTMVFTQGKTPPLAIESDCDLSLFRKKCLSFGGLNIFLSFDKIEIPLASQQISESMVDCVDDDCPVEDSSLDDQLLLQYVESVEAVYKKSSGKGIVACGQTKSINSTFAVARNLSALSNLATIELKAPDVDLMGLSVESPPISNVGMKRSRRNGVEGFVDKVSRHVDQLCSLDVETSYRGRGEPLSSRSSDERDPDYHFEELISLINCESISSPENPQVFAGGSEKGQLMAEAFAPAVIEGNRELGQSSRQHCSRMQQVEVEPIGFSLGIEGLFNDIPSTSSLPPVDVISDFTADYHFMAAPNFAEHDLFFNDAPPELDTLHGPAPEDRNMDLKMASDAIYVGRVFANKSDLSSCLAVYAMKRLFSYRLTKSEPKRVIANCVDRNCCWRMYATAPKDSNNFEIRTAELKHTCDVSVRSKYGSKATSKILAMLLQHKFANGKKGPRACELPDIVLSEFNVNISYMKAWHAKEVAIATARGNDEDCFRFLSTYLHLLGETNPGSLTDMVSSLDKNGKRQFKYLFLSMAASMAGYRYLRKVVVVDGTQMKGKYKGCLVAACGQDGNMQIYLLAFGVVDSENENSWVWFFRNLSKIVPDEQDLVIVSDRHAAIYSGIRQVYPLAHHGACTVHLFRNIKSRFKNEGLAVVVSKAARAYTVGDFRYWWTEIEKRSPACANYLLEIGLPHWTLSHFPGNRYNIMSSNICESLNSAMAKAVEYPIVCMMESLRTMLMRWFFVQREKAKRLKTRCTPEIEAVLISHLNEAVGCAVFSASTLVYQVNDPAGCVFSVDLEKKTCTCRVFDVLKVPCCHALAARGVFEIDEYSLIDDCYGVKPLFKLYEQVIMPLPRAKDIDVPAVVAEAEVNPPKTKRGSRRPRKVRIPSRGEGHGSKTARIAKCGRCFGTGHNRKTCKNPI